MPIPVAHGAHLLLSRLLAEPWIKPNLSQPLCSHALRSLRRSQSSLKRYAHMLMLVPVMLLSAHGASQLLSNQHAETLKWLLDSHLLYSNAPTYQLKRVKKKRRKTQASEDSSPECSNMERNIKVEDITEVVKINQKDVMEDMVDQVNMVITEDMEVMEDPRDMEDTEVMEDPRNMEDTEITEDMEDMMERSMDIAESIVNKVDTVK